MGKSTITKVIPNLSTSSNNLQRQARNTFRKEGILERD